MNTKKAEKLQKLFEDISKECDIEVSLGYFIDDNQTVIMTCNNINDKDLLRLAELIVTQVSARYEIPPEDILGAMLGNIEEKLRNNPIS